MPGPIFWPPTGYEIGFAVGRLMAQADEREPTGPDWREFLRNDLCSLCGNRGVIDTRGMKSPAGVDCGDVHYCICPNGRAWKRLKATLQ